jgi:hypothetical protein
VIVVRSGGRSNPTGLYTSLPRVSEGEGDDEPSPSLVVCLRDGRHRTDEGKDDIIGLAGSRWSRCPVRYFESFYRQRGPQEAGAG